MTTTAGHRARGALAGVLSAAAGLGTGELVAALVAAESPVVGVGQRAIDLAPPFAKDFAVSTFGTNDKPILVGGVLAAVAVAAAVAGGVGVVHRRLGLGIAALLGLLGLGAALTGPRVVGVAATAAPGITATVVSVAALALLLNRLASRPRRATRGGTDPTTVVAPVTPPVSAPREATAPDVTAPVTNAVQPATMVPTRIPAATGAGAGAAAATGSTRAHAGGGAEDVPDARSGDELPSGFDRRSFLVSALAVGAVAAGATAAARTLVPSDGSRAGVRIPRPADGAPALPAGVNLRVPGITPYVTANGDFYRVDTQLTVPRVAVDSWRLTVHGMVARELMIDFRQLLSRPLVERYITLTCVSNEVGGPYVGNAKWIGVPISDVLREAGVDPDADAVKSTSTDGMTIGTPLSALTDGREALLAVAMNGEPLPHEHGFPVRMVVPGLYGYVSATKWVTDLEVTRFDAFSAYWTSRGYAAEAPIKTESRIDVPKGFAEVRAGRVAVAGVAWAQTRGIARVQVRSDGGPWGDAHLGKAASADTWRQWAYDWDATPGQHRLEVRATDESGDTQTGDRSPIRPDGATGWHSVVVTVI